jgi:spore coat polysaccharide biosynthesis predicted glycosyltransferase SpsG
VAFEFDFLYDVLSAIQNVANSRNLIINLNIKVRPNGYIEQYKSFVKEYFPLLKNVNFIDSMPMKLVLEKTDFYITFYSQTLFEASTLGIPVAYYRKDNEIMDSPFDGKSELVTLYNIEEITDAVVDFIKKSNRYDKFLKKEVMEKYIGSLDGKNTERNLRHIYSMLS